MPRIASVNVASSPGPTTKKKKKKKACRPRKSGSMVGKKQGSKAALREEGLAKTDNRMPLTSWPLVNPINQKNYYTEFLKRDDQYLALRQEELREEREERKNAAANKPERMDVDGDAEDEEEDESEALGSKTVIIHPGSQNLRIGFGSDALPKTVPMVVARKSTENESEEHSDLLIPRRKPADDSSTQTEKWFTPEFAAEFGSMCTELKQHMRQNKLRLLPNCKELVINFNRKALPDVISEHNDPLQINWTEIPKSAAPAYITGDAALRIPDDSTPRYKLKWPIRHGWLNEQDYSSKEMVLLDYQLILEDAIKNELGLQNRKDISQYECVFIIPDLYDKAYVIESINILLRDIGFRKICLMQESTAATYGAGYLMGCIVDVGAQKTSVSCVEEGLIVENSRVNVKIGGADVTDTFMKMMLYDYFPYDEINLLRRYDFLLAEELKQKHCTMKETDVSVLNLEFHLRVSGQDTYKYPFKTYDETILAPMGLFRPSIFELSQKPFRRRHLVDRSYDLYDGSPNDPVSAAQIAVLQASSVTVTANGSSTSGPSTLKRGPLSVAHRLTEAENTPRSSVAGSPAPEGTPQPKGGSPAAGGGDAATLSVRDPAEEKLAAAEERDKLLPVMSLDQAIITSVTNASTDERKIRDFLGSITVVGGGSKLSNFNQFLEDRLKRKFPYYAKDVLIGEAPRELDSQVVVWKGGSVFGKLDANDSWVSQREYDRLGARVLTHKCHFVW